MILNLSIWFALHTLFGTVHEQHVYGMRLLVPEWATIDLDVGGDRDAPP